MVSLSSRRGPNSSGSFVLDCLKTEGEGSIRVGLVVPGKSMTVGIAQASRVILIQNGSQMFQLIAAEAKVGPMKDTT